MICGAKTALLTTKVFFLVLGTSVTSLQGAADFLALEENSKQARGFLAECLFNSKNNDSASGATF